ncbi:ER degradation-enhancing alpha-mannosidase-like protein 3 isoform X2 [Palaemon carinicauda]|uniref:ER degradation-enhancing alpha-mannosidase-like protein 3 isoform X2 n=1 Tax=Palaemon carinicauda TaxID=392227 RepID=UPI0035B5CB94
MNMFSSFYSSVCFIVSAIWLVIGVSGTGTQSMSEEERLNLKEEAKEMFYHGYTAYMDNAYPADELMPLSCKGRWRNTEPSRGDIDDTLGNFSLTLVDSLDTLVVMGDIEEFDRALRLVVRDVTFDHDVVVSVFETNIRMVGGLISGHVMAEHLNQLYGALGWYRGELLTMARDLATKLLPAFNTTTGIPHPKVNLKYGMKSPKLQTSRDTCTSCAGTIILEFAALSRLTGDPIFEEKARQAMDCLWSQRHRGSDLVGTVLNVHSGDWVRRDSGVGAGIDSYYEYLLKAYVLLGDEGYLDRFNKHYSAIMKYISQGPMLLDVHMHRPHTTSRNFMDALLAFWPGLQVLKGDIKPAIETHEMLYQVIQRHNFLPEAFTTDFQVHWGGHPLRPEFLESTYLLYLATDDPYYLRVGEQVLRSLQKHAWVPCGYAAVKDVRTGVHEDRMDSFVLSETFKYLYLLFAKPSDLIIDMDQFIFTTEAHLLPLSLARLSNLTVVPIPDNQVDAQDTDVEYARSCPNAHFLFPGRHEFAETIRRPLKNFVNNVCPSRKTMQRKLRASEFQAGNSGHMRLLRDMGITIMALPDGRVQLLHTSSNAKSSDDAEEGLLFMQEMIELSKLQQEQPENPPRMVSFTHKVDGKATVTTIQAGPAQFGLDLKGDITVRGKVVKAHPLRACGELDNEEEIRGKIVIMERGDCMFIEKARKLKSLGGIGGIVLDNTPGTSASSSPMFAMSGDGNDDVDIPLVFLFAGDAEILLKAIQDNPDLEVVLGDFADKEDADEFEGKPEDEDSLNFEKSFDIKIDNLLDDDDDDDDDDDEDYFDDEDDDDDEGNKDSSEYTVNSSNSIQENILQRNAAKEPKDVHDLEVESSVETKVKSVQGKESSWSDNADIRAIKNSKLTDTDISKHETKDSKSKPDDGLEIDTVYVQANKRVGLCTMVEGSRSTTDRDISEKCDSPVTADDTGKGIVEEVQVQMTDTLENIDEFTVETLNDDDGVTVPTVRSIINSKRYQGGDSLSDDDLVTVVEGQLETQQARPLNDFEVRKSLQMEILKLLDEAQTAEEIMIAAIRYINIRQLQDQPSSSAVSELQNVLIKKTASNPGLLHSLLNIHLRELSGALPQVSTRPSSSDAPEVHNSLHNLLTHLSTLTANLRKFLPVTKDAKKTPSSEQLSSLPAGLKKGDLNENSKVDHLTDKLHEKLKKLKKKYEGMIPQHIEDILDDNQDMSASLTKEAVKKDEL